MGRRFRLLGPLGERSAAVHDGAELVRAALRALDERRAARAAAADPGTQLELLDSLTEPNRPAPPSGAPALFDHGPGDGDAPLDGPTDRSDPEGWAPTSTCFLGERAAARVRPQVALPGQLSVTQLVELAAYRVAWAALVTQTNDRAIKV